MAGRDDKEFVAFAAASREQLRRTAYLLCGDWHRSSDVVQEALIRVYVAWPRLERRGGVGAYARKAVVSVVIDQSRRRSSTEEPRPTGVDVPQRTDVAKDVVERDLLMRTLATLPPRQRACVVMRYFEDLDVAATAQVLGCSEGTVKSQTSRALASLRSTFEASSLGELLTEGAGSW